MHDPPPALTKEGYDQARNTVQMHDHAICTFEEEGDLLAPLRAFIEEGIRRQELSVFVHSFADEAQAWDLLDRARPGASQLRSDQLVVVSLYTDAFQGEMPKIDYDHVMGVVEGLTKKAEESGRAGVRIFVDASRVYFKEKRSREWFDFESWLGRHLQPNVGLVCAYRREDAMRPDLFPDVLATHAYRFDAPPR